VADDGVIENPWASLRTITNARIALGRAGVSKPTRHHLAFQLAHARARDAVHSALDVPRLAADLQNAGFETIELASAAVDRATYLQRPDLGRRLSDASVAQLPQRPSG
jgi:ethanolamine ammonia-lyase small subunit